MSVTMPITAPITMRLWFLLIALVSSTLCSMAKTNADIVQGGMELIDSTRVSRYDYQYTYQLTVANTGGDVTNVKGTVTSASANTVIVDGELSFPDLSAGESAASTDTFIIQHNRREPFDPSALSFAFTADEAIGNPDDLDGDGFTPAQGDCNEGDSAINPGAASVPNNGIDENCDGRDPIVGADFSVRILSPASLITVGTSPLPVNGVVEGDDVALTVNGVAVDADDNGNFSVAVALEEGYNTVVARAVKADRQVTDSIAVSLDLTPPYLTIESHRDGQTVYSDKITVTGLINDIVRGTIEAEQANVAVNGISAAIVNRSYSAMDVPLVEGENTITVSGVDQVGNTGSAEITVNYVVPAGRQLKIVSGQNQTAPINTTLDNPLAVQVLDDNLDPVADTAVVFRVTQGAGQVGVGTDTEGRAVVVDTDAEGMARTRFILGSRVGAANHKVTAKVVGYDDEAVFFADATGKIGNKLSVNSGNNQRGAVGQLLPEALVVVVTDDGANVVKDARVRFTITKGAGELLGVGVTEGSHIYETTTDSDGRATAEYRLGFLQGLDAQRITATLLDAPTDSDGNVLTITAGFTATGFVPGEPGLTRISGVVLDNQDTPIPGVTVRVDGSDPRQAVTDDQGQFTITEAPVGPVHLIADGSTATVVGEFPSLAYNIVTIAGVDNPLSAPIYMVKLDTENAVLAGSEDVSLTLDRYPGFQLDIAKDSVTFPDGSREGLISVTAVNASKVPMAPPNGMQPQFIVTIQPAGARFDPVAKLTLPNVDGHAPGAQVEMYSFDHDLEEFVSIGLGTVSEDGSVVSSNPGVGVVKAGWHCGSQPGGNGCAHNCPICQDCDGDCNCVPAGGDPRLASLEVAGDCKKPECQGGSATQVPDDSDVPDTPDVEGDCKKPGCENGIPKDIDDNSDISQEDAKCKKCEAGSVITDKSKDDVKCGNGSPEQDCLICKDGNCQQPDCDAAGEQVSLSIGREIDADAVPGLGKLVAGANKVISLLPISCTVPAVSVKGSYKKGEDCCQDCSKDDKGEYHQVSGSGEVGSDCIIGKRVPPLDINWPITVYGWGIQVEIKGEAELGVTLKPALSVEASGKYNFACEEGCVSGEGKLAFPIFGGVSAKIRKAEAEVKFGSFGDWDVIEINGPEITGGLSVGTISLSMNAGFGAAQGCDAFNCGLTLGEGKLVFTFNGGSIELFDIERLTVNLSEYINWELEVPLWSGKQYSCL